MKFFKGMIRKSYYFVRKVVLFMTTSKGFVRYLLGPARADIRPIIVSIGLTVELLYVRQVAQDDLHITRDIYPEAAKSLGKPNEKSVAKAVERLAANCWNALEEDDGLMELVIGKRLRRRPSPHEILFYLACFVYRKEAFYKAERKEWFKPTVAF